MNDSSLPVAHRYFDFTIASSFPLPELESARTCEPFLSVAIARSVRLRDRFRPVMAWTSDDGVVQAKLLAHGSSLVLEFPGVGEFEIASGAATVRCIASGDAVSEELRHLLLTSVLPMVTAQRGRLVLHASCVTVDGIAALFVGRSGAGKSTLAAGFVRKGHRFVSDDCVLFVPGEQGPTCVAPFAELRLWSDSASALLLGGVAAGDAVPGTPGKSRVRMRGVGPRLAEHQVTIGKIYVLELATGRSTHTVITPLTRGGAFKALLASHFRLDPRDTRCLADHFTALAALTASVPVSRLAIPRGFELLSGVCEEIAEDLCRPG